jgi:hypothetical protein
VVNARTPVGLADQPPMRYAAPVSMPSSPLAAAELPASLAPAFQEYDLAQLSLDRDAPLIIERVLALGARTEIRWLFATYPRDVVAAWVREMGHRRLPWRRYTLWCVLLDVPRQARLTTIWPH